MLVAREKYAATHSQNRTCLHFMNESQRFFPGNSLATGEKRQVCFGLYCLCSLTRVFLLIDGNVGFRTADYVALEMLEEFGKPFAVRRVFRPRCFEQQAE